MAPLGRRRQLTAVVSRRSPSQNLLMPLKRCLWCTSPPVEEVAVLKWRGEERERLTVQLCGKHLKRLRDAGAKGRETKGWLYKIGWW